MKKIKFLAIIALLGLLIVVTPAFAEGNSTTVDNDTVINDYYFDANVENDSGNGSIDNPYKNLEINRIKDDSRIHLANGSYNIFNNVYKDNVTIIGQNPEKTIIYCNGYGFSFSSTLSLNNVTLVYSHVTVNSHASLTAKNVIFKDTNSINSVIYSSSSSKLVDLENCTFMNNFARNSYGGAIRLKDSILKMNNCLFISNGATFSGGAISCEDTKIFISKSRFIKNYAINDAGGAIYLVDSDLVANDSEISDCYAAFGGAITSLSGDLNLTNITAKNNKATYNGGAIYKMYRISKLVNSSFDNNSAMNGGAVYADMVEDFRINSNNFTNNVAYSTGGAVYSLLSETYYSILDDELHNEFINNTAANANDAYESDELNMFIGNNNYISLKYNSTFNGTLPARYDLRDYGLVTPVKNQGSGGNCWAFSAFAALESAILKATGISYDLSEENMKNIMSYYSGYGWSMDTNTGGYDRMAIGYLTSWLGPINESEDIYDGKSLISQVSNGSIHIQNILFLTRSNYTDNDAFKKAILDYGAISTSVYWGAVDGKNYYYTGNNAANHAIAIVGWDDDYNASNFKVNPPGNGAWIIKNSWGKNKGEEGYYYVSYYDKKLAQPGRTVSYAFVLNDTIKFDKNYQYDISGKTDIFLNTSNTVWYKNKFVASDDEYLSSVSTYFDKETSWVLSVYVNDVLKLTKFGNSPSSYSTIDLNTLIPLKRGDIFVVEFKITVEKEAAVPISEAVSLNNEIYKENISFISYDGKNWVDFYDLEWTYPDHIYNSQVACIKAFTVFDKIDTKIILNVTDSYNPVEISAVALTKYGTLINSGTVTFNVEGKQFEIDIKDGIAKLHYSFENPRDNLILATYNGEGYIPSSANITTNVGEAFIVANDMTAYEGNVSYSVSVVDKFNNPISNKEVKFNINNRTYISKSNNQGMATVSFNLNVGNYSVGIDFNELSNNTFNLTRTIKVISTIILPSMTKYTLNSKYSPILLDNYGNPLKNVEVTLVISGKNYTAKTDSQGMLNYNIGLAVGSYQITIINPSNKELKTQSIKVVARITGNKDMTMYYGAGSSYKVRVYDDYGNIAKGVEVTFTIDGKTYSRYSDSNGYASLKINLNPKTYTITAKYKGYKVSNKIVVKPTLVCKDMTVKRSKIFSYSVKLLDKNGKILKNKYVKVKFRGKTYSAKTNSKGYATFKLPATYSLGKLTLTAIYGSAKVSKKITVKK